MHFFTKSMMTLAAITSFAVSAYAIPAKPGLHRYQNPDGSSVEIRVSGDEHACYYTSSDGYVLMPSDNGSMCYAVVKNNTLVSSHMLAKDAGLRYGRRAEASRGSRCPGHAPYGREQCKRTPYGKGKGKDFQPRRPRRQLSHYGLARRVGAAYRFPGREIQG